MSEMKVGGWGRILLPQKLEIWHEIEDCLTSWAHEMEAVVYCDSVILTSQHSEFADSPPEGARLCKLCPQAKAKKAKAKAKRERASK